MAYKESPVKAPGILELGATFIYECVIHFIAREGILAPTEQGPQSNYGLGYEEKKGKCFCQESTTTP